MSLQVLRYPSRETAQAGLERFFHHPHLKSAVKNMENYEIVREPYYSLAEMKKHGVAINNEAYYYWRIKEVRE